jgi:hypothetical protein
MRTRGADKLDYNELTEHMVEMRAGGHTFASIGKETGVEPAECAARVNEYLHSMYSTTSVVELRMLQLRRSEMVIGALWDQVMKGDLVLEGKGATNIINAITQITELMDLKKDRLRDEQVQLTRAQSYLLQSMLDKVRLDMLGTVLKMVEEHKANPLELIQKLNTEWDGHFAMHAETAMLENESVTAQLGPGAKEFEA